MLKLKYKRTIFLMAIIVGMSLVVHASFGLAATIPPDSYEPNNTMATAAILSSGNSYQDLTINNASDNDYYNFTIDQNNPVIITLYNQTGYLYANLYDSAGNIVQAYDSVNTFSFPLASNTTETYCLWIYGVVTYYALNLTDVGNPNENDDNFNTAQSISLNSIYGDNLFDVNYYQVTLSSSDMLNITLFANEFYVPSYGGADVNIQLYYPNETLAADYSAGNYGSDAYLTSTQDNMTLLYFNNQQISGNYYIVVIPEGQTYTSDTSESPIQYSLSVLTTISDDQYEPNNNRASATPITYNMEYATNGNGFYGISLDDDWYSVSVTNTSQVLYFLLSPLEPINNLELDIVDSNGNILGTGFNDTTGSLMGMGGGIYAVNYTVQTPGTYYLYIHSTEHFAYYFIFSELYVSHPADISFTQGTLGNAVVWHVHDNIFDTFGDTEGWAEIYQNGHLDANNTIATWSDPTTETQEYNLDNLTAGTYNFEIIVHEPVYYAIPFIVSDSVIVTVNAPPQISISGASSLNLISGTTGNNITWISTATGSITSPTYSVYRNGTQILTNTWSSGTPISVNVDGLSTGSYNYTIIANGGNCQPSQATTIVTITTAGNNTSGKFISLTGLLNDTYVVNSTGNSLSWIPATIYSFSSHTYTVFRNGTSIASGQWNSGKSITINIDGLGIGTYNFTVIANGDTILAQNSTIVTVIANNTISNNTGSNNKPSIPGYNVPLIILSILGSIAAISSVIKKKMRL